jgi:hypothetical protein
MSKSRANPYFPLAESLRRAEDSYQRAKLVDSVVERAADERVFGTRKVVEGVGGHTLPEEHQLRRERVEDRIARV